MRTGIGRTGRLCAPLTRQFGSCVMRTVGLVGWWRRRCPCHTRCRDEGSDSLRRGRHAPAPHHPHQRQAVGTGGEQADPLLRPRAHDRRGHPRVRHRRRRHERRDHGGRGRRQPVGRRHHVHPAGRAAGPRPLRADQPRLPRRRRLHHVPRRQHDPAGRHQLRRALRGRPPAAPTSRRSTAIIGRRRRRSCCVPFPIRSVSVLPKSMRKAT